MKQQRPTRAILVHSCRAALVAALLLMIPSPRRSALDSNAGLVPPSMKLVRGHLPEAVSIDPVADAAGLWQVVDSGGKTIARVARTLPESVGVIGYRGPSEAMILIDDQQTIIGVDLIASADTDEHVEIIVNDSDFFKQFLGWNWAQPKQPSAIDGVSGATLTSLALAKGVLRRMGGEIPSLVFPDAIDISELSRWYPDAASLAPEGDMLIVLDANERRLGRVLRTGKWVDTIIGYQGPTELLLRIDVNEDSNLVVGDLQIRSSYDNQPYVGYCKTEYSFWPIFENQTLGELAAMDLQESGVEGVSGATMTSIAIAETLVATADRVIVRQSQRKAESNEASRSWPQTAWSMLPRLTVADGGCILILCLIPLFRARGYFRSHAMRGVWLVAVTIVVGFWSGNLVSLALIAGWSAEGVAWELAPALAAILTVAFVSPVVGKSNAYCSHLCAHGVIQQLIRPTSKNRRRLSISGRTRRLLTTIPSVLLIFAYVMLLLRPRTDLSSWEPFHAYLLGIAPWASLAFAALTLAGSAFVPMGYCQMGCPTGRLLDYLRRNARSDRVQRADWIACLLLLFAIAVTAWGLTIA